MITVEDKLKTFSKFVYEKELNNSRTTLSQIRKSNGEILALRKKEFDEKYLEMSNKMKLRANSQSQKILAMSKQEAREKILGVKKDLLNQFNEEIAKKFIDFKSTSQYQEYLAALLDKNKQFLIDGSVNLYMVQDDIDRFKSKIMEEYPSVNILPMDQINIGGLIIEMNKNYESIDMSVKELLSESKEYIGIRLYETLEKE